MAADILVVGDALIDSFLSIQHDAKYCHVDRDKSEIFFDLGSKILVEDAQFLLGGNACNVSVGLSRLGFSAMLAAEIGTDEFSEKIINGLKKENILLDRLVQTKDAPSTFSVCLNFKEDRTLFVRHVVRKHDISLSDVSTLWVYLTSVGKEWKHVYKNVQELVSKTSCKLAFNPGSTQIHEGRESFRDILSLTDILFVNREEAEEIVYGAVQHTENETNTPQALTAELQKFGARVICLTDGERGSFVRTNTGEFLQEPIVKCTVVEKTGAGDAYASGFMGALLSEKSLQEAMLWGATNSASVIGRIGAQPGLLTKKQIIEKMNAK